GGRSMKRSRNASSIGDADGVMDTPTKKKSRKSKSRSSAGGSSHNNSNSTPNPSRRPSTSTVAVMTSTQYQQPSFFSNPFGPEQGGYDGELQGEEKEAIIHLPPTDRG